MVYGILFTHDSEGKKFIDKFFLISKQLFPDFGEITWMGEDIRYNLAKELDFVNEAHNALRAKENLKAMKNVHVPEPYLNLTTRRVLTMEFIHGIKITDLKTLKDNNLSVPEIAQTMIEIFARQIFCYGFVHCDPHRTSFKTAK